MMAYKTVSFSLQDFWVAVEARNLEFITTFLRNFVGEYTRRDVSIALCHAGREGDKEFMDVILSSPKKPDLQYVDDGGMSVLHNAVTSGDVDTVRKLLDAGALINFSNSLGYQALHIAMKCGYADLVKYLIQKGAQTYATKTLDNGYSPLHIGVVHGNIEAMVALLETRKISVNVRTDTKFGWYTSLHLATRASFYQGVKLLFQWGANLNSVDIEGRRAIHFAASAEDSNILNFLIEKDQDIEIEDDEGRRPLHYAVTAKRLENVEQLLKRNAKVHIRDSLGYTPLHKAVVGKSCDIVKVLLDKGADPNLRTYSSRQETPLILAIGSSTDSSDIVETLLIAGADVRVRTTKNESVLHRCQGIKDEEVRNRIISTVLDHGAELNVADDSNYTALHTCVFQIVGNNFSQNTMMLLVQAGAHMEPGCKYQAHGHSGWPKQNSPLCVLVWRGFLDAADYLVRSGWDISNEAWMFLPGKNEEHNKFHEMMRNLSREVYPLSHLCRKEIRKILIAVTKDSEILSRIRLLPLPTPIKDFLSLKERTIDVTDETCSSSQHSD